MSGLSDGFRRDFVGTDSHRDRVTTFCSLFYHRAPEGETCVAPPDRLPPSRDRVLRGAPGVLEKVARDRALAH